MLEIVPNFEKMHPTKDYMSELNRLFPKMDENYYGLPNTSVGQSFVNQSSSSADSTSPDTFPDMSSAYRVRPAVERGYSSTPIHSNHMLQTHDQPIRGHRPIIGRKIFGITESSNLKPESSPTINFDQSLLPVGAGSRSDDFLFRPQTPNVFHSYKNRSPDYELFPSDNKGFEFKSPVKQNVSPIRTNFASNLSNLSLSSDVSPVSSNFQNSLMSNYHNSSVSFPISPGFNTPISTDYLTRSPNPRSSNTRNYIPARNFPALPTPLIKADLNASFEVGASRFSQMDRSSKLCTFCRKNGELASVFSTHSVKEIIGNRHVVTCPILRSHVCSICGATGDNAHTLTYCPVLRSSNNGRPLPSTTITLKSTRTKSNETGLMKNMSQFNVES